MVGGSRGDGDFWVHQARTWPHCLRMWHALGCLLQGGHPLRPVTLALKSFFWQLLMAETYWRGMEGCRELSGTSPIIAGCSRTPSSPWHAASAAPKLMASHQPCHPPRLCVSSCHCLPPVTLRQGSSQWERVLDSNDLCVGEVAL